MQSQAERCPVQCTYSAQFVLFNNFSSIFEAHCGDILLFFGSKNRRPLLSQRAGEGERMLHQERAREAGPGDIILCIPGNSATVDAATERSYSLDFLPKR